MRAGIHAVDWKAHIGRQVAEISCQFYVVWLKAAWKQMAVILEEFFRVGTVEHGSVAQRPLCGDFFGQLLRGDDLQFPHPILWTFMDGDLQIDCVLRSELRVGHGPGIQMNRKLPYNLTKLARAAPISSRLNQSPRLSRNPSRSWADVNNPRLQIRLCRKEIGAGRTEIQGRACITSQMLRELGRGARVYRGQCWALNMAGWETAL